MELEKIVGTLEKLPTSFPDLKHKLCAVQILGKRYVGEVVSISWDAQSGVFSISLAHAQEVPDFMVREVGVRRLRISEEVVGDWLHEHHTTPETHVFYSPDSPGYRLMAKTGDEILVVQSYDYNL